ncbi:MAG: hypothetical protein R3C61_02495 [Bacteroidia bacterium]
MYCEDSGVVLSTAACFVASHYARVLMPCIPGILSRIQITPTVLIIQVLPVTSYHMD